MLVPKHISISIKHTSLYSKSVYKHFNWIGYISRVCEKVYLLYSHVIENVYFNKIDREQTNHKIFALLTKHKFLGRYKRGKQINNIPLKLISFNYMSVR